VDERWYWLLPLALDTTSWADAAVHAWLDGSGDDGDESALAGHIRQARETVDALHAGTLEIGSAPDDLLDVIARMIVAAPGITATRALAMIAANADDLQLGSAAAHISRAVRTLFNVEEVTALVRSLNRGTKQPYWRLVLDYCVDGCLQSVFDEYAHVLAERTRSNAKTPGVLALDIAETIEEALSLRTTTYRGRELNAAGPSFDEVTHGLRGRFALRFGDEKSDESGVAARAQTVRGAFNSPFWPFVVISTSVGQEGLDFHLYCHAIVHWNLPPNPVDMEQREGRIHRYKNHAVRRNIAERQRGVGMLADGDPWQAMFDQAASERVVGENDLVPSWIYTAGRARLERYVPTLPLSRDAQRLERMRRSLAIYRLAFGQPRQTDLLELVSLATTEQRAALDELQVRLTPPS
jgi:hypothetical protein